jgi:hypothetical protein
MRKSISFRFTNKRRLRRSCIFLSLTTLFFVSICFQVEKAAAAPFMFGVTIDDPWDNPAGQHAEINDALSSHAIKPTVRIVFDEEMDDPAAYRSSVLNITSAAFVMGEIVDSFTMSSYSVQKYIDRTEAYLDEFEHDIDIWEIGNEVNGNWLGATADVVVKIEGAYSAVKARGLTTALNLYYNKSCLYNKQEYEMFTWVDANISEEMKNGLDYVFFSYYEDNCENVVHTQTEWQEVFDALHAIFPNAKLGFGEVGTEDPAKKAEYMHRYYELDIKGDYFVGGYFWWYYKQDCVPKTTELWNTLNDIIIRKRNSDRDWLPSILHLLL